MAHTRSRFARVVFDNSLLLLGGTIAAVLWANFDLDSYDRVTDPLHVWVNDIGMVFFFGLAAKEVFEATLRGGPLASARQAVLGDDCPRHLFERASGYSVLLLLAIADDALGLMILAVFYTSGTVSVAALGMLMAAAVLAAVWLKRRRVRNFWAYVLGPGSLSWAALYFGGFHPALALVPVVPFMPHSQRDLGLFDPREDRRVDTLSQFEHWWATPVQFVLLLFGLATAGVPFAQVGPGTYFVLAGLLLGKPIGIVLFARAARLAGATLPTELRLADLVAVGITAAIGFTVSLFFATAAFPAGAALAETKMGALLSFSAAPLAVIASRLSRRRAASGLAAVARG